MATETLVDTSGNDVIVNEGESAFITATFKDETDAAIDKASLASLTLTLQYGCDGEVINSRDAQSVLDANGGSVAADGVLTMTLSPSDTVIRHSGIRNIVATFTWTWVDGSAVTQTGKQQYNVQVNRWGPDRFS